MAFNIFIFIVLQEIMVPKYTEYDEEYNNLLTLLWIPGTFCGWIKIIYPLFSWMICLCFGVIIGRFTFCMNKQKKTEIAMKHLLICGIVLFFMFLVIKN